MPSNVFHNNLGNDANCLVSGSYIFRQVPHLTIALLILFNRAIVVYWLSIT